MSLSWQTRREVNCSCFHTPIDTCCVYLYIPTLCRCSNSADLNLKNVVGLEPSYEGWSGGVLLLMLLTLVYQDTRYCWFNPTQSDVSGCESRNCLSLFLIRCLLFLAFVLSQNNKNNNKIKMPLCLPVAGTRSFASHPREVLRLPCSICWLQFLIFGQSLCRHSNSRLTID